jgi:hypothetical protein
VRLKVAPVVVALFLTKLVLLEQRTKVTQDLTLVAVATTIQPPSRPAVVVVLVQLETLALVALALLRQLQEVQLHALAVAVQPRVQLTIQILPVELVAVAEAQIMDTQLKRVTAL